MKQASLLIALLAMGTAQAQSTGDDMLAGMSALRAADHQQALTAFSRVVVAEPSNAKAWYYRGVSRLDVGDAEGAVSDLDRALSLAPDDLHALLRRAEACIQMDWNQMARTDLEHLLLIRADGPIAEHGLLLLGQLAMRSADLVAAKSHYDRLLAMAPYNTYGWVDRGIVNLAMGLHQEAVEDLEHALDLDPTLDQAYGQLALAYYRMDRKQEACHAWQLALQAGDPSVQEALLVYCQ